MRVSDLMTTDILTVGPEASLKEAARRMLEGEISGLPVINDDGDLVGIITEADFMATEADRRVTRRAGLLRLFVRDAEIPSHERLVGDVMTTDVKVIGPESDHAEAARLMEKEGIKRIPVVADGRLIGLIARADMLKAYVRSDQEIIDEIQGHVMKDILWIDSRRVEIECVDGNVIVSGHLETKSDASLLIELTRRLDGVTSVSDHLTWEVDNTKLEMVSPPSGYARGDWIVRN